MQEMQLSQVGKIAQKYWREIPEHFNYVDLDQYVIMPNHIHGIIVINNADNPRRDVACYISTNNRNVNQTMAKLSPKSGSLSAIIRSINYKINNISFQ